MPTSERLDSVRVSLLIATAVSANSPSTLSAQASEVNPRSHTELSIASSPRNEADAVDLAWVFTHTDHINLGSDNSPPNSIG